MSEEPENNQPRQYSPASPEELEKMKQEIAVIINLMGKAEHGIGGGELDRPMPYVAERVKRYLEAKISITDDKTGHGMSRMEAVDALSQWTRVIEARDAELKKQANKGVAG